MVYCQQTIKRRQAKIITHHSWMDTINSGPIIVSFVGWPSAHYFIKSYSSVLAQSTTVHNIFETVTNVQIFTTATFTYLNVRWPLKKTQNPDVAECRNSCAVQSNGRNDLLRVLRFVLCFHWKVFGKKFMGLGRCHWNVLYIVNF